MSKKSVFSWQIIDFLNDFLEFFENLLEFFFCLSFFGLEFFSKCPKKSLVLSSKLKASETRLTNSAYLRENDQGSPNFDQTNAKIILFCLVFARTSQRLSLSLVG